MHISYIEIAVVILCTVILLYSVIVVLYESFYGQMDLYCIQIMKGALREVEIKISVCSPCVCMSINMSVFEHIKLIYIQVLLINAPS